MERTTQDNAAIAQQNSAASNQLHDEVITLDEAIDEAARMI
jgi:methyl-accepting chemotaxis protein